MLVTWVTLVNHSFTYRVPDGDILTNDATTDVLAIEVDLGGTALTLVDVYIPPVSSCPRNYAPDLDALLEKRGDQMVFGDFNAHHLSWFSRAAARGEALDEVVNSSQLAVANIDMRTRLFSQGQPSSPDVTLLSAVSGHLVSYVTWSTDTTLGSGPPPYNHLPPWSRPAFTGEDSVLQIFAWMIIHKGWCNYRI